jgi:hypothetical protein
MFGVLAPYSEKGMFYEGQEERNRLALDVESFALATPQSK